MMHILLSGTSHQAFSRSLRNFFVFGLASVAMFVNAQSTPQGSITMDGKKMEFKHVYAFATATQTEKKRETRLPLTDKPLSPLAMALSIARHQELYDKVQSIEFTFDDKGKLAHGDFRLFELTTSGISYGWKAEVASLTDTVFKGRVYSAAPEEMSRGSGKKFFYDFRFDAAIIAATKPNARGAVAWATAQGKVVAEYLRAASVGDKAALTRVLTSESAKEMDLAFVKNMSPSPKGAEFDSLTVVGNDAEAVIVERLKDGSGTSGATYRLRLINGAWLISL